MICIKSIVNVRIRERKLRKKENILYKCMQVRLAIVSYLLFFLCLISTRDILKLEV